MKKYINSRSSSFTIFDIKYTEIEKQTISNYNIENERDFYYYGKFDPKILIKDNDTKIDILTFIKSIGYNTDKDINIIKKLIYKLLNKLTKAYDKYYIILDISISLKDPNSLIRWHIDGFSNNSKFATTLIGPSTLFIDDTDIKSRNIYFTIQDELMNEYKKIKIEKYEDIEETHNKYNKIIRKKLKNCKIVQPTNNQGVIFLTDIPPGTSAGIHSEPIIDKNRFYIGLLCCTKSEMDKIIKYRL